MSDIAKVFWTGRSQAVRLPKAYRFVGEQVLIRREGDRVILEAAPREDDAAWAERIAGTLDADAAIAALDRPGPATMPEGPAFD